MVSGALLLAASAGMPRVAAVGTVLLLAAPWWTVVDQFRANRGWRRRLLPATLLTIAGAVFLFRLA